MGKHEINKIDIYIFIYLFLMFYKPALLPVSMNYIIAVWSLIGVVIKENGVLKVAKHYPFGRFFLLFIPLIVYLFVAINFTSGDSSIISLYAIYFSYIIQGYYAVLLLRERFQCYDDAMMMIVRVGEVQCILTLLMAFISPLRDSILSYLMSNSDYSLTMLNAVSTRIYGIAGEYLYGIGLLQGMISLYLLYVSIVKKKVLYSIEAIIMLIPAFLNARIGVVCFFAAAIFLAVCLIMKWPLKNKFRLVKIIGSVMVALWLLWYLSKTFMPTSYEWIQEGFNAVLDLLTGQENRYYGKLTNEFLVWPSDINFIFGLGVRPAGSAYYAMYGYVSDIGYVIDVHIGGIILAMFFYGAIVSSLLTSWKYVSFEKKLFLWAMIIFLALANYKGRIAGSAETIIMALIFAEMRYFECEEEDLWRREKCCSLK